VLTILGRGSVEKLKSAAIVTLAVMLAVSLEQLATERQSLLRDQDQRQRVVDTAHAFGVALTTYDYAHPEVQERRLTQLATAAVIAKARQAQVDLVRAKASSTGEAAEVFVQDMSGNHAVALIRVSQAIQDVYTVAGTRTAGLLKAELESALGGWRVVAYEWLSSVEEVRPAQR
jgi:hypothetical protein